MTLTEILPAVRQLPILDKIRLIGYDQSLAHTESLTRFSKLVQI